MATPTMPVRGERGAPVFDPKQPNDLNRYFTQLEALFARCEVELERDKKHFATIYVEASTADSWEALSEYSDPDKTYADLKRKLQQIYNQGEMRYILADLDCLIGERQRIGMRTLQDLSDFHLRFNAISGNLIANQLLSAREQSQSYIRVFDESLQARVTMRLQIKFPNHHPALPYSVEEIFEAAQWVLQGVPSTLSLNPMATTSPTSTSKNEDSGFIKAEHLSSLMSEFAKTMAGVMSAQRPQSQSIGAPRTQKCNFDGCDKFIRDCPGVKEYIRQGKCKRNFEGKVVLSSGAYVPRNLPGENLRDRIDEWYKRYPDELVRSPAMFNAVVSKSRPTIPTIAEPVYSSQSTYQLSAQDRIAALEAELFNLRVRTQKNFVPVIKT